MGEPCLLSRGLVCRGCCVVAGADDYCRYCRYISVTRPSGYGIKKRALKHSPLSQKKAENGARRFTSRPCERRQRAR
eukprot:scaffold94414_cov69-Phaeocystis_antarctica.AAC.5